MSDEQTGNPPTGSAVTDPIPTTDSANQASVHKGNTAKLALGALGVVYGDIGTSPLYALKECVTLPHGVAPITANVFGLLSLVFWSITLVVLVKYILFVMRADNHGEGGVLALMALAARLGTDSAAVEPGKKPKRANWHDIKHSKFILIMMGLFGAALLSGEGIITPAISVLSAVEGLEVATSAFSPFVVPLTCAILIAIFWVQKRGTAGIGAVFGPVTLLWFIAIAASGLPWIFRQPQILGALNPVHAIEFFVHHGKHGFLVLGSVVLCVTGCEALYADMGHFGPKAIRTAWVLCVFPALLLNYFGQGALLLARPEAASNPFYAMVPSGWLYPMVILATIATVVASQALISGAFSLTRQAVQLGYLPRVTVVHTSGEAEGQIYIPEVNRLLMVSCVALVLAFQESGKLAAAYGIAVTGTMAITSILLFTVARERWGFRTWKAALLLGLFLSVDLSFFGSCIAKVAHGGWFPLTVAVGMFTVMLTWNRGRTVLGNRIMADTLPLPVFLADVEANNPHRVPGTAVFLASTRRGTPGVLLHHFKHNKVLHQQVLILSITTDAVPEVPDEHRVRLKNFGLGFWAATAHYGFMESPDVMVILKRCRKLGLKTNPSDTSFYLGRETLIIKHGRTAMAEWRRHLYRFLSRNARSATDFFSIPPNRVVEIGAQIEF